MLQVGFVLFFFLIIEDHGTAESRKKKKSQKHGKKKNNRSFLFKSSVCNTVPLGANTVMFIVLRNTKAKIHIFTYFN